MTNRNDYISEAEIMRQAQAYRAQVIADFLTRFFAGSKEKAPAGHPVAAE